MVAGEEFEIETCFDWLPAFGWKNETLGGPLVASDLGGAPVSLGPMGGPVFSLGGGKGIVTAGRPTKPRELGPEDGAGGILGGASWEVAACLGGGGGGRTGGALLARLGGTGLDGGTSDRCNVSSKRRASGVLAMICGVAWAASSANGFSLEADLGTSLKISLVRASTCRCGGIGGRSLAAPKVVGGGWDPAMPAPFVLENPSGGPPAGENPDGFGRLRFLNSSSLARRLLMASSIVLDKGSPPLRG
mmetsp:Transcript_22589/g.62813  ORF Transcript_22589/g.62813 Transcript_22589/m.62813 type:complete len:247 (-) Transcript_22589:107-847(-)